MARVGLEFVMFVHAASDSAGHRASVSVCSLDEHKTRRIVLRVRSAMRELFRRAAFVVAVDDVATRLVEHISLNRDILGALQRRHADLPAAWEDWLRTRTTILRGPSRRLVADEC